MGNTIDKSFFFLIQQIENLRNISVSKKVTYILPPLLPISALVLSIYLIINTSWIFTLLLIASLILTFILSFSSYYFLKGRNIFITSKILHILESSIKDYTTSNKLTLSFLTIKHLEIKLIKKTNNKEDIKIKTISFSEVQSKMITNAFNTLTKEIISDDNTLKDFIATIKYLDLKKTQEIKLELESKHCAVFLRNFFIPYVMILTNKELTLNQASRLFKYRKKNGYRSVNADSISKKHRQLSTQNQREIYKTLLDELKKVS